MKLTFYEKRRKVEINNVKIGNLMEASAI